MSTYDSDDVLVPPGVRALTRPGVTYIPAPPAAAVESPPVPPRPTPPPPPPSGRTPLPPVEMHPVQPQAPQSPRRPILEPPRPIVVVVSRGRAFRHDGSLSVSAAEPNAALLQPNAISVQRQNSEARSLAMLRPPPQDEQMHPVQPKRNTDASFLIPGEIAPGFAGGLADAARGIWHGIGGLIHHGEGQLEEADAIHRALDYQEQWFGIIAPQFPADTGKPPSRTFEPRPIESPGLGGGGGVPQGDLGGLGGGRAELDY